MPAVATQPKSTLHTLLDKLLRRQKSHQQRTRIVSPDELDYVENERRKGRRRTFYQWQLLAWYDGKRTPTQVDFHFVECRDLSPLGFSFYCDALPKSRRLIIAVGTVPFVFFEAEVIHREPGSRDRIPGWIVGCRFVRQLKPKGNVLG